MCHNHSLKGFMNCFELCSAPYFLLCGVSRSLCFCKKTLKIIYESLFSACHCVLLCMCECASVSFLWFVCECVAVLIIKTAGTAIRQRVRATNRLLIHLIQTHPAQMLHTHTYTQRLQFRMTLIIGSLCNVAV